MSSTKIEFAVQMTCNSCVEAVKKSLENLSGVHDVIVNLENNSVVVDTSLPTLEVQQKLEKTGRKVVVKGYAGSAAGVAILDTGKDSIQGVVRFVQVSPNSCVIDGTVDGLEPGTHRLTVHECGDISQGCKSVGNIFNQVSAGITENRVYGDLGTFSAEVDGRASFRKEDNVLKLSDIIGRSLVVTNAKNDMKLACGIVARSAGLFENPKTICACDGISIWDERSKPKKSVL